MSIFKHNYFKILAHYQAYKGIKYKMIEPHIKNQTKCQLYEKSKHKHMMVFNLPQDSDSESDYVPNQSQISEIQCFKYDHQYYNKLRSRLVQDRQNFGFRQIIINYPSLNKNLLKNRRRKATQKMKAEINSGKKVKLEYNKQEVSNKLQNLKRNHQGNIWTKIQENCHLNKKTIPLKIQQTQKQSKQTNYINVIQKRHRIIKKIAKQPFVMNQQIYIQVPQGQLHRPLVNDAINQNAKYKKEDGRTLEYNEANDSYYSDSSRQLTESDQQQQN